MLKKVLGMIVIIAISIMIFEYFPNDIFGKSDKQMPIHRVERNDKKVALSFDVAWGSRNMNEILDILESNKIKTSFFLVGSWVDDNEELVKKINEKGHEIGNHSYTHAKMTELKEGAVIEEVEKASEKIENITGKRPTLYRPPFGDFDNKTLKLYESLGYKTINWDIDSLDWKEIGANHVVDKVVKNVKSGSIILFHANVEQSPQYIEIIINKLKADGYELVTVSDLIYDKDYIIDEMGTQKNNK